MNLIPNQAVDLVSFCKAIHHVVLMFIYTLGKVRGNTRV